MSGTWNFETRPFVTEEPRTVDPPEAVQQCLNCKKPECINCFWADNGNHRRGRRAKPLDEAMARRLYTQGLTDAYIARCCDVSAERVKKWRAAEGLPRNPDRMYCLERFRRF